jgi:hypothetical protein
MKFQFNMRDAGRGRFSGSLSISPTGIRHPSPWGEGRGEGDRDARQSARPEHETRPADLRPQPNSGVALVITLILLAVITFMTVTFLVVTRSETGNVKTATDQTTAMLAAEEALEQAKIQMVAPMLAFTNAYTPSYMVSTNYQSPWFTNGSASYLNVNYFDQAGNPLTGNNALQNLANQLYLPRAPVFITNSLYASNEFRFYFDANRNGRFEPSGWLIVTNSQGLPVQLVTGTNQYYVSNFFVGDPQWVGILERGSYAPTLLGVTTPPGFPHGPNNRFISRYAFMIVPSSLSLDVNHMHNYSRLVDPNMIASRGDCFLRNMGAASWELNLGAFLCDVNTNLWPPPNSAGGPYNFGLYSYNPSVVQSPPFNFGSAFDDALSLLRYRYNANWSVYLASFNGLFGLSNGITFGNDLIDGYPAGPVATFWATNDNDKTKVRFAWAGADNYNQFTDPQDWWDYNKTAFGQNPAGYNFTTRLKMAGTNVDSYNRYTFSRLAGQLGTESSPEPPKLNLNYANVDKAGNIVPNLVTNFQPWDPAQFFTNAAIRMLKDTFSDPGNPSYITNFVDSIGGIDRLHIRIWPTNYYTPAVHRILQVAANIYDAANTRRYVTGMTNEGFPTLFQPLFTDTYGARGSSITNDVYITDYREITNANHAFTNSWNYCDLFNAPKDRGPALNNRLNLNPPMIYGVPVVVGARKGFPNFNALVMQTDIKVSRKLEFRRPAPGARVNETNEMYVIGISNAFGAEAWNSYASTYPRPLQMVGVLEMLALITNQFGNVVFFTNIVLSTPNPGNVPAWQGMGNPFSDQKVPPFAFIGLPLPQKTNNVQFLTNSTYSQTLGRLISPVSSSFERLGVFPVPHWWLVLRTRLRYVLVEPDPRVNRIVDYVNLQSTEQPVDITEMLEREDPDVPKDQGTGPSPGPNVSPWEMWYTNRIGGPTVNDRRAPTYGIINQINLGLGKLCPPGANYSDYDQDATGGGSTMCQIEYFRYQLTKNPLGAPASLCGLSPCNETGFTETNVFHAPFVPRKHIVLLTRWEANDPLVHYTVGDLNYPGPGLPPPSRIRLSTTPVATIDFPPLSDLGTLNGNRRYEPWWTGNPVKVSDYKKSKTASDLSLKDAQVMTSDRWDFPTNKLPNIGWLGRVHRGTPWQTIYLKSPLVGATNATQAFRTWTNWSGHTGFLVVTNPAVANSTNVYWDYTYSYPTNDYHVLDYFTTAFNDNASRGQLSVNNTNLASWSAVLSGIAIPTNMDGSLPPLITQPAGIYDPLNTNTWPPLVKIVDGLSRLHSVQDTNTGQFIYPNQAFTHVGDILNAPELTFGSPYLNGINANVINDEMYERIPQQIMSLLRGGADSPRFVVYAFGQALKPAEHSVVTGGQFSGMITNYQIVAEAAVRAVIRVEGAPKNPHVVVESYNVLPPYQ